jgi:hypothetical protein
MATHEPECPACGCADCEELRSAPYQLQRHGVVLAAGFARTLVCRHCGRRFTVVSGENSETRTASWWDEQSRA